MYERKNCLVCQSVALEPLIHIMARGYPHGHRQHEVSYRYKTAVVCRSCGQGQLESYSHDCWGYHGDEDWDMYWWFLFDVVQTAQLSQLVAQCPTPLAADCACDLHRSLQSSCERLFSSHRSVSRPNLPKPLFASLRLDLSADGVLQVKLV